MLQPTKGIVPEVVNNVGGLYEGDLRHYFRYIFDNATNLGNPYHNFRHLMYALVAAHEGCDYHRQEMSKLQIRVLLIAVVLHDANNRGKKGNDHENIKDAIRVLEDCILPEDTPFFGEISRIIWSTEYPHKKKNENLSLDERIMRDADMTQIFYHCWFQDIIFGLGSEWRMTEMEMLSAEVEFLEKFKPCSGWGMATFTEEVIRQKREEVKSYIDLLKD